MLGGESNENEEETTIGLRACLHEVGGPQIGEVTPLGGAKKKPSFKCNLTAPPSRGALS